MGGESIDGYNENPVLERWEAKGDKRKDEWVAELRMFNNVEMPRVEVTCWDIEPSRKY